MIRVVLADDQQMFRAGLRSLLGHYGDLVVVGEACDGEEAVRVAAQTRPDVILMDIRMPRMDGIAATKLTLKTHPAGKVLILTTFEDDNALAAVLRAGAMGYILKDTPGDDIADLIRMAHRGYAQFSSDIAAKLSVHAMHPNTAGLSARERDVLLLLGEGLSNREIAARLCVAEGTVRNYVSSILTCLGLKSRMQAALYAKNS